MARGTWADAVRVREGRRALERRRGDPFVRTKRNSVSASLYTRYSQRADIARRYVYIDTSDRFIFFYTNKTCSPVHTFYD